MNKKNKNTVYIIVLLVLVVIYGLSKFVFNAKQQSNFDMSVLDVDTAQIASFSIKPPQESEAIKFFKKNNKWQIKQGDLIADADKESIDEIFQILANLKIENIAGTNESKFKDFRLTDSLATKVELYDSDNKLIKNLYIGKFSYTQNGLSRGGMYGGNNIQGLTYVRLANDKNSFIVKGFLPMTFNRNFNNFRNQQVLHIDKSKISQIAFRYPADTGFVLQKTDSVHWLINKTDTALSNKVDLYLGNISIVKDSHFKDSFTPDSEAVFTLNLAGNMPDNITIRFYRKDSVNFVVNSSQNPDAYFVVQQNKGMMQRLLKDKKFFVKQ